MNHLQIWITILGMSIVALGTRAFFVLLGSRIQLPDSFQRAVRYAPAAVLVGLIVPELLPLTPGVPLSEAWLDPNWTNPKLWGGLAAFGVCLAWRNLPLTIGVGMAVFTLMQIH